VGRVVGVKGAVLTKKVEKHETLEETTYTRGDYMVAVRWWHRPRDDADSERLTFMEDDYAAAADTADDFVHTARASSWDVFNSTELRAIKLTLTVVPGLTLSRAPRRSTRNGGSGQNPPAEVRLRLHAEEEQIILDACW
jgi:hypothetical protein